MSSNRLEAFGVGVIAIIITVIGARAQTRRTARQCARGAAAVGRGLIFQYNAVSEPAPIMRCSRGL
jgi:hypothetical protein